MAKKLSDFTVKVNLKGWYIKGYVTCARGQEFEGDHIHPRMVDALEAKETFRFNGADTPVCVLKGGKLEELKEAMQAPKGAAAPKPEPKVEPKPKPKPEVEQDKPTRKPKPRD